MLKSSLRGLFKSYGEVVDVVAHSNLRMRGQAFVSFTDPQIAKKAMKEVKGFPLYSKPMVSFCRSFNLCSSQNIDRHVWQQISFARSRSDAVVMKLDAEHLDEHKARRAAHKSELYVLSLFILSAVALFRVPFRSNTVLKPPETKIQSKTGGCRRYTFFSFSHLLLLIFRVSTVDGAAAPAAPKRPNVQMPDEYLPPNKILFLQNLPETSTKEQLQTLFNQYPNLYEVRLIPTKKDIAFVEYIDEGSAGVAKDALHNFKLDGENKIKVRRFRFFPWIIGSDGSYVVRLLLPGSDRRFLGLSPVISITINIVDGVTINRTCPCHQSTIQIIK